MDTEALSTRQFHGAHRTCSIPGVRRRPIITGSRIPTSGGLDENYSHQRITTIAIDGYIPLTVEARPGAVWVARCGCDCWTSAFASRHAATEAARSRMHRQSKSGLVPPVPTRPIGPIVSSAVSRRRRPRPKEFVEVEVNNRPFRLQNAGPWEAHCESCGWTSPKSKNSRRALNKATKHAASHNENLPKIV